MRVLHNWEEHDKKIPGKFGESDAEAQRIFRAVQGEVKDEPGTTVGYVRERMGDTDIALAQLDDGIVFENKFLEVNASAKTLIPSEDQRLNDTYLMDSFVTGIQRFKVWKDVSPSSGTQGPSHTSTFTSHRETTTYCLPTISPMLISDKVYLRQTPR